MTCFSDSNLLSFTLVRVAFGQINQSQRTQREFEHLPTTRFDDRNWSPAWEVRSPTFSTPTLRSIRPLPQRSPSFASSPAGSSPSIRGAHLPRPATTFHIQVELPILHLQRPLMEHFGNWSSSELKERRKHLRCWPQTASSSSSVVVAFVQNVAPTHFNFDDKVISLVMEPETQECFMTCEDITRIIEILLGGKSLTGSETQRIGRMMLGFKPQMIQKSIIGKEERTRTEKVEFYDLLSGYERPKVTHMKEKIAIMKWINVQPFLELVVKTWRS